MAIASRKSRERNPVKTCSPSRLAPYDFRFSFALLLGLAAPVIQYLFRLFGKKGASAKNPLPHPHDFAILGPFESPKSVQGLQDFFPLDPGGKGMPWFIQPHDSYAE